LWCTALVSLFICLFFLLCFLCKNISALTVSVNFCQSTLFGTVTCFAYSSAYLIDDHDMALLILSCL
jgi:hypothetical protein